MHNFRSILKHHLCFGSTIDKMKHAENTVTQNSVHNLVRTEQFFITLYEPGVHSDYKVRKPRNRQHLASV